MRVLSFIPAFLFAAASLVAAAPASAPADTSCVSNPSGGNGNGASGNGNDAALQPVISIIANATTYIQPLSGQLGMFFFLSFSFRFSFNAAHPMYSGPEGRLLYL